MGLNFIRDYAVRISFDTSINSDFFYKSFLYKKSNHCIHHTDKFTSVVV